MDYLRLAPDIDSDPDLEDVGWWGTRVYELLLKVSASRDLRGRFSQEHQRPSWLARRWGAPDALDPVKVISEALDALVRAGKLTREADGTLVIKGWERWYPTPKTGAERTRDWRDRRRDDCDERDVTTSQARTVTPTAHHSTPPADLDLPAAAAHVARTPADEAWERLQQQRESKGLLREATPPASFPVWWATVVDAYPKDTLERLAYAHRVFVRDKAFAAKEHATDVFMKESVYRRRMPAAVERKAS